MYRNLAFVNTGAWCLSSLFSGALCYQYYKYHKPVIEVNSSYRYVTVKNHNSFSPFKIEQIVFYPVDFEVDGNPYVKDKTYLKREYETQELKPEICKVCYKEALFGKVVCDKVKIV